MPSFHDSVTSTAAPEQVWKLLDDPGRFPDWWTGVATVESRDGKSYTMYPEGYADFPTAQVLESRREENRVTVSCLVSDLRFDWRLAPVDAGTEITVDVEIPEAEAHRLDGQREVISMSLRRLAELANHS